MTYKHFEKYVLRSPLLPISFFFRLTQKEILSPKDIKEVCVQPIIKEALFLASPALYESLEKWLQGSLQTPEAEDRVLLSILKYLSRMSSRCTPFGLFAGTAIGSFDDYTSIQRLPALQSKRHTRLDMNYVVALSQDIIKNERIAAGLKFYPNTSIYSIGNQLRYVEYHYENTRRVHHIVGVTHSEYLEKILARAQEGATLDQLAQTIVDDEIEFEVARGFIDELVESQVIVSELEPSVSGEEFDAQLLKSLSTHEQAAHIVEVLKQTRKALATIDTTLGNPSSDYIAIANKLDVLGTAYDLKYLFQTDMMASTASNTLDRQWLGKAKGAIKFLNKLAYTKDNTLLKEFMEAFQERYEEREVPLAMALDVELGIGFLQQQGAGDVSDLVDDIVLPPTIYDDSQRITWNPIHRKLHTLLQECLAQGNQVLQVSEDTFEGLTDRWDDVPDTIATIVQLVNTGEEEQLVLSSCGGTSATNLLGRFCYGDPEMHAYVAQMVAIEKACNPNAILAEIVHLPEARVGNILMRPRLRAYEIPYLAKSTLAPEMQLPIEDLMISVRQNRVRLRSKKHNREVIPYLSNAHNYSNGALPIYQFLANLQAQGKRRGLSFEWGSYASHCPFLPRVVYRDVILSVKTWHFKKEQVLQLKKAVKDSGALKHFIKSYKLPQYVLLIEGDNELLINLYNRTSVRMLLSSIGKQMACTLKEFLHLEKGIVTDGAESYTNQIVLSFYNHSKANSNA